MPAWYQGAPARSSQAGGLSRRGAGLGEPLPLDTPLLSVPSSLYTSALAETTRLYTSGLAETTRLYSPPWVDGATSLYSSVRTGSVPDGKWHKS